MITHKIKYLTVMDGLNLLGIISEHDLMSPRETTPWADQGNPAGKHDRAVVAIRKNIDLAMRVILQHGAWPRIFAS